MYQTSTLTLQMFVSAGGLNVLVEFLDEDYETSQSLVLIGVNGIWNVFELQDLRRRMISAASSPGAKFSIPWPSFYTKFLRKRIRTSSQSSLRDESSTSSTSFLKPRTT